MNQSLVVTSETRALLATLIETLRQDNSLSEQQRTEALQDADSVKTEVDKSEPNWKVVGYLLKGLGAIGTASNIATQLIQAWKL